MACRFDSGFEHNHSTRNNVKLFHYSSIGAFRNVIEEVRGYCLHFNLPRPTLVFEGTVKAHGTNCGVIKDLATGQIYAQSREHVITPENDNYGFAQWVADNNALFEGMFHRIRLYHTVPDATHYAIYGEWFGGKDISQGVGISDLSRKYMIFSMSLIKDGMLDERGSTLKVHLTSQEAFKIVHVAGNPNVRHTHHFSTRILPIDFSKPESSLVELIGVTNSVEAECPVAKHYGVHGIGEGVVWKILNPIGVPALDRLIFKVKGDKHQDSHTNGPIEIDVEKVANVQEFADVTATVHRFEKMVSKLKEAGGTMNKKGMGEFLRLLAMDIQKEEGDRLAISNLVWKDVAKKVAAAGMQWYLTNMEKT